MPKAHIVTPTGLTVQVEGTVEEVAALVSQFSNSSGTAVEGRSRGSKRKAKNKASSKESTRRAGPTSIITELAGEGYFKTKRSIGNIQKKLEELGHIYAQTSISPILTRLTRKKVLRRLKEGDVWVYVS